MANTLRNVAVFCLTLEKPCFTFSVLSSQLLSGMNDAHRFLFLLTISLGHFSSFCLPNLLLASFPTSLPSTELYAFDFPLLPETWWEDSSSPANAIFCKIQFYSSFSIPAITNLWHSNFEKGRVVSYKEPGTWSQMTEIYILGPLFDLRYWEIQCLVWVPVSSSIKWIK